TLFRSEPSRPCRPEELLAAARRRPPSPRQAGLPRRRARFCPERRPGRTPLPVCAASPVFLASSHLLCMVFESVPRRTSPGTSSVSRSGPKKLLERVREGAPAALLFLADRRPRRLKGSVDAGEMKDAAIDDGYRHPRAELPV